MVKSIYKPVGRCIYCGSTDELSDEHIIPYSLGWDVKLPLASCRHHRNMTGAFEGRCAGKLYKAIRALSGMQSRRPQPTELPIDFWHGDRKLPGTLPMDKYFGTFPLIHFPLPGILRGLSKLESSWVGTKLEAVRIGALNADVFSASSANKVVQSTHFDIVSLGRMLAKIAHATAVAQFGYSQFTPWLLPLIEDGTERTLSYLVGSHENIEPVCRNLHDIRGQAYVGDGKHLIVYDIRLFSILPDTPTYQVVVGEVSPAHLTKTLNSLSSASTQEK